jgi:tetratricopeptide (TPR) repeat protein
MFRAMLRVAGLVLLSLALGACEKPDIDVKAELSRLMHRLYGTLVSDYDEASIALSEGDWDRAAKYLERFLRTEKDPEKRWPAWELLLTASGRAAHDRRWISEYLETMAVEFADNPDRMRRILSMMGEIQEYARDYERAIVSWYQVVALPGLSDAEKRDIYLRLATLQMRLNRQTGAENSLSECRSLPLPEGEKADCLYAFADLKVLNQDLEGATELAGKLLAVPDIDARLRCRVNFLLADIYEQQQQFQQALDLFATIRDAYPNPLAVDERIAYLKNRLKK